MAKLKTIYQYFQDYTRAQIDTMILKLTLEERALIRLRYGLDLDNPVSGKLTADQNYEFYGMLVPKMKKLLANPNYKQRARKKVQRMRR